MRFLYTYKRQENGLACSINTQVASVACALVSPNHAMLCCAVPVCCVSVSGGKVEGLALPERVFPCKTPAEVRANLPKDVDVLAFQCRNPIHR